MDALRDGRAADGPGGPPPLTRLAADPAARATAVRGRDRSGLLAAGRATLVLLAVVLAYHYSLLTLVRNLALDTPLAYLGLVPFIALLLAVIAGRRRRWEPNVHDRYVDYIIGVPLILLALLVTVVLPVVLSSFYWRWRLDLLSLPVFVAGAVTIVFGLRTAARLKGPIAFLFLAWPLPYTLLVNGWLQAFTTTTVSALRQLVAAIPVARAVDGSDGSLFFIPHGSDGFLVSVGAACAGVNGSLGFLLVGTAVLGVVRGGLLRKAFWLANGLALTVALNLARIMLIFGAGNAWGQGFAIDALHPVIGLVTFNVAVLASVLALPLFGLRPHLPGVGAVVAEQREGATAGAPSVARQLPVKRAAIAMCIVVASSALAGTANAGLRAFQPMAEDLGQPRLSEWSAALARVEGWTVRLTNSYPWVEQYFGRGATWNRYAYLASPGGAATPVGGQAPRFVNLDVITTRDLGTFSTYGLEACYGFHNYEILEAGRVDLGAGIVGRLVAYYNPSTQAGWTALYWEWPVRSGADERYERVILNVASAAGADATAIQDPGDPFADLQLAIAGLLGGSSGPSIDPALATVQRFLVGFGRELILTRADHADAGVQPDSGS